MDYWTKERVQNKWIKLQAKLNVRFSSLSKWGNLPVLAVTILWKLWELEPADSVLSESVRVVFIYFEQVLWFSNSPGDKSFIMKENVSYFWSYRPLLLITDLSSPIGVSLRKLHCMRNNIHMNLFGSFILRALSILLKDALLDRMSSAQSGPHHFQGQRWVSGQVPALRCHMTRVVYRYRWIQRKLQDSYWNGLKLSSLKISFCKQTLTCIDMRPIISSISWKSKCETEQRIVWMRDFSVS